MNQCVPSWELEDNHRAPHPPHHHNHRQTLRAHSNSSSLAPDVPTLDYEVAELTWENGQLAMHGLGPPRLPNKNLAASFPAKYNSWEKQPPTGGTLESIVNQATTVIPHRKSAAQSGCHDGGDEILPWFEDHRRVVTAPATTSLNLTMDALVPCSKGIGNDHPEPSTHVPGISTCVVGCSTMGSCSGAPGDARLPRARVAAAAAVQEWSSSADQSVSGSATCGRDSRPVTLDTCDREFGAVGYTSTSFGSPENTSYANQCTKTVDDHDSQSPCQSRSEREAWIEENKKKGKGKSSVSTKRSRAAAIHNQSERKRRDKITQRMKTLQKLVPNSSKTDKASMLDEVIEYMKQLQAQVNIMSRMNMSPMMLPLALQQLQMSMMAPIGIGMNMGLGMGVMDLKSIGPNIAGIPPILHPTAYMPATSAWDSLGDRLAASPASALPDPLAAFLAWQSQPMTMDAYSRMATLYQQFQQPPGPASKNKVI